MAAPLEAGGDRRLRRAAAPARVDRRRLDDSCHCVGRRPRGPTRLVATEPAVGLTAGPRASPQGVGAPLALREAAQLEGAVTARPRRGSAPARPGPRPANAGRGPARRPSPPPRRAPPARAPTAGPRAGRSAESAASSAASSWAAARLSPAGTTRLTSPIRSASSAPTGRPVRIMSIARLAPIRRGRRTVPPSISGTPQRRQNTPEHRVLLGHAQIAPQRQLQPAGHGVAGDRGDHRLGQPHPGRAHRPVAVVVDAVAGRGPDGLQVGAGAERAARAVEHRDRRVGVGVERAEGVGQRGGGRRRRRRCAARAGRAATVVTGPSRVTATASLTPLTAPPPPGARTCAAPR